MRYVNRYIDTMSTNANEPSPKTSATMASTQLATSLVLWRQWLNAMEKGSLTFRTEVWT